jgi:hypothetical protein
VVVVTRSTKMTPRRISCLKSIARFGTVSVTVQFGWQEHWKCYTVASLNELVDSTQIVIALRQIGMIRRCYPGSMNYCLSSRGIEFLCRLAGLPYHINCRCAAPPWVQKENDHDRTP